MLAEMGKKWGQFGQKVITFTQVIGTNIAS